MALAQPSAGLEELVDASSGRDVMIVPPVVDRFEELRGKYLKYLNSSNRESCLHTVIDVLSPEDINLFLQTTSRDEHEDYYILTGMFISQLIQCSFAQGHNQFYLNVRSLKPIEVVGYNLVGLDDKKLELHVQGRVGINSGACSHNIMYTVDEVSDYFGSSSTQSTFVVGTVGKMGDWCGIGAEHSTFKTYNQELYRRFKKFISKSMGNTSYLLAADGSIIEGGEL